MSTPLEDAASAFAIARQAVTAANRQLVEAERQLEVAKQRLSAAESVDTKARLHLQAVAMRSVS